MTPEYWLLQAHRDEVHLCRCRLQNKLKAALAQMPSYGQVSSAHTRRLVHWTGRLEHRVPFSERAATAAATMAHLFFDHQIGTLVDRAQSLEPDFRAVPCAADATGAVGIGQVLTACWCRLRSAGGVMSVEIFCVTHAKPHKALHRLALSPS